MLAHLAHELHEDLLRDLRSGHHLGKLYTALLKSREEAVAKSCFKYLRRARGKGCGTPCGKISNENLNA